MASRRGGMIRRHEAAAAVVEDNDNVVQELATAIGDRHDTDVLLYTGHLVRPMDTLFIQTIQWSPRRANAILILTTPGGDADCAYRIARCLQSQYSRFTIWATGMCKSAGTLVALGAHEILMSECGELGPLDVQERKRDELTEVRSGLAVDEALSSLCVKAFDLLERHMLEIVKRSLGQVSFKTAVSVASGIAVGLLSPIYAQIDPLHLGELARALKIGTEYGERLSRDTGNLREGMLDRLVRGFASHSFVIDRREADEFFHRVKSPEEVDVDLIKLEALLDFEASRMASMEPDKWQIAFLSRPKEEPAEAETGKDTDGKTEVQSNGTRVAGPREGDPEEA